MINTIFLQMFMKPGVLVFLTDMSEDLKSNPYLLEPNYVLETLLAGEGPVVDPRHDHLRGPYDQENTAAYFSAKRALAISGIISQLETLTKG
jgi:hypothetical protein